VPHTTPAPDLVSPSKLSLVPNAAKIRGSLPGSTRPVSTTIPENISQKSLFLALYARYMSGEKRKLEDSETILGPADGPVTSNKELPEISATLETYFNARGGLEDKGNSQGWLDYLYGVALMKSKSENLAKQWLLRSVDINPYNWAAWQELASSIGSLEELQQISEHLPRNIMTFMFHIYCSQELYQTTPEVYNTLTEIQKIFPRSAFLQQQKALLYYHSRDHEQAMQLFDGLIAEHPHRIDGLEIYSNLLYVLPNRPKLATLAATASDTDKFRPETNCILGNYYSLISEHEKAVLHFRRALALDRSFQAAWTLMGHEYIELKNTQAAIESYRRAVDANRKDYRAWYGLGQGYEMLECYSYSLFYYQRTLTPSATSWRMLCRLISVRLLLEVRLTTFLLLAALLLASLQTRLRRLLVERSIHRFCTISLCFMSEMARGKRLRRTWSLRWHRKRGPRMEMWDWVLCRSRAGRDCGWRVGVTDVASWRGLWSWPMSFARMEWKLKRQRDW
jgi:anaphase-promoting complex subunit 8